MGLRMVFGYLGWFINDTNHVNNFEWSGNWTVFGVDRLFLSTTQGRQKLRKLKATLGEAARKLTIAFLQLDLIYHCLQLFDCWHFYWTDKHFWGDLLSSPLSTLKVRLRIDIFDPGCMQWLVECAFWCMHQPTPVSVWDDWCCKASSFATSSCLQNQTMYWANPERFCSPPHKDALFQKQTEPLMHVWFLPPVFSLCYYHWFSFTTGFPSTRQGLHTPSSLTSWSTRSNFWRQMQPQTSSWR